MAWFLPLALAGAGALLNKRNPIQGALLGAGAGLLAPATGIFGSGLGPLGTTVPVGATGNGTLLGNVAASLSPLSNTASGVMSAANAAGSLAPDEQPQIQPPPLNTHPLDLRGLLQGNEQQKMYDEEQTRLRQRAMTQAYGQVGRFR